jgi:hypothetical protein
MVAVMQRREKTLIFFQVHNNSRNHNVVIFQCYFSKDVSFDGIFSKIRIFRWYESNSPRFFLVATVAAEHFSN